MDQNTHEKMVDFGKYCPTCKHSDKKESDEPCDTCLANPVNFESVKPCKYENGKK